MKEGVSRTYKGCDGFAPIFSYIGREGYLVNEQLRKGSQHCQCGTPDYLKETFALCKQITDKKILFRLDSGNDAADGTEKTATLQIVYEILTNAAIIIKK